MRAFTHTWENVRTHARIYGHMRAYTQYVTSNVYICMHLHMYVGIYARMYGVMWEFKHICKHLRTYSGVYVYVWAFTHICEYVRTYVCIYSNMRASTYVCELKQDSNTTDSYLLTNWQFTTNSRRHAMIQTRNLYSGLYDDSNNKL